MLKFTENDKATLSFIINEISDGLASHKKKMLITFIDTIDNAGELIKNHQSFYAKVVHILEEYLQANPDTLRFTFIYQVVEKLSAELSL